MQVTSISQLLQEIFWKAEWKFLIVISRDIEGSVFANIHDFKNLAGIFRFTEQNMKFSIKDFFSKWHQNRSFLQIWSHLLKKSLMENFIFCAVLSKQ